MLSNANHEQVEYRSEPVLRLIKNDQEVQKKEYFLYYNSGIFPILMFVIFFLCAGIIINIGLRIQNMNYDKRIYSINQLISSEKERTDRLNLKISELKSPSRIADKVFAESEMNTVSADAASGEEINKTADQTSEKDAASEDFRDFKNLDIEYSKTANDAIISDKTENDIEKFEGVKLVSILKSSKDILLVVSEGILTFFIP